jgi:hypothetical protein
LKNNAIGKQVITTPKNLYRSIISYLRPKMSDLCSKKTHPNG